jgi:hypothetical protein
MSIQRWKPTDQALQVAGADVEYVAYADHVAALADAEQRMERITREDDNRALWDNRQWNAALDAAREATLNACGHQGAPCANCRYQAHIIDALRGDA